MALEEGKDSRALDREYKQPEGFEWQKIIELEGDIGVVDAILGKKLGLPEFEGARPMIVLGAGGLSSVSETGLPLTLERRGLVDTVDTFIGYSGGATEVLYLAGKHAFKSAYMWMAAASDKLGSFARLAKRIVTFGLAGGPLVDIPATVRRARDQNEKKDPRFSFDQEAASEARKGHFIVVAWDIDRNETVYLDLATMEPDAVQGAHASANVPYSDKPYLEVELEGEKRRLTDVGMGSFDFAEIRNKFNPTHVLIAPALAKNMLAGQLAMAAESGFGAVYGVPKTIRHKLTTRDTKFGQEIHAIRSAMNSDANGPKVLIAWPRPETIVPPLSANTNEVRIAARNSLWAFTALFGERSKKNWRAPLHTLSCLVLWVG